MSRAVSVNVTVNTQLDTVVEHRHSAGDSELQLPTTIVDGNKDPNSAECGHESIQVNNDESKSIGLTVFAMLECHNCTTRMAYSFTNRKMKGSETF